MEEKYVEKLIGYALLAIIASWILQMVVPFLIWAVIGMVAWRIYSEYQKRK